MVAKGQDPEIRETISLKEFTRQRQVEIDAARTAPTTPAAYESLNKNSGCWAGVKRIVATLLHLDR